MTSLGQYASGRTIECELLKASKIEGEIDFKELETESISLEDKWKIYLDENDSFIIKNEMQNVISLSAHWHTGDVTLRGGGGGGAENLTDLQDVSGATTDGQMFYYNALSGKYEFTNNIKNDTTNDKIIINDLSCLEISANEIKCNEIEINMFPQGFDNTFFNKGGNGDNQIFGQNNRIGGVHNEIFGSTSIADLSSTLIKSQEISCNEISCNILNYNTLNPTINVPTHFADLTDVSGTNVNGQMLYYDSTSGKYQFTDNIKNDETNSLIIINKEVHLKSSDTAFGDTKLNYGTNGESYFRGNLFDVVTTTIQLQADKVELKNGGGYSNTLFNENDNGENYIRGNKCDIDTEVIHLNGNTSGVQIYNVNNTSPATHFNINNQGTNIIHGQTTINYLDSLTISANLLKTQECSGVILRGKNIFSTSITADELTIYTKISMDTDTSMIFNDFPGSGGLPQQGTIINNRELVSSIVSAGNIYSPNITTANLVGDSTANSLKISSGLNKPTPSSIEIEENIITGINFAGTQDTLYLDGDKIILGATSSSLKDLLCQDIDASSVKLNALEVSNGSSITATTGDVLTASGGSMIWSSPSPTSNLGVDLFQSNPTGTTSNFPAGRYILNYSMYVPGNGNPNNVQQNTGAGSFTILVAGNYMIMSHTLLQAFNANATQFEVRILQNNTTRVAFDTTAYGSGIGHLFTGHCNATITANVGDTFTLDGVGVGLTGQWRAINTRISFIKI